MRHIIRKSTLIGSVFLLLLVASCGDPSPSNTVLSSPDPTPPMSDDRPKIVAFGDSLTGGYGLASWQQSYPALLQNSLDAEHYNYQVLNYGLSGDTSAGGLRRLDLALQNSNTRIFIVALGANDVSKKVPADEIKANLSEIVKRMKARNAAVLLCGITTPTGNGDAYAAAIRDVYASVARENGVPLLPSLMEGVSGRPGLLQDDGIHPNADGAKVIQENVMTALRPMLVREAPKRSKQ